MAGLGWPNLQVPNLGGQTAVVTGGSDGIGRETAAQLAEWGARVVLPVRNHAKGAAAAAHIRQRSDRDAVVTTLDLADLASVRAGAEEIETVTGGTIDLLVNCAGGVTRSRQETTDGFEQMLGTNCLAPFLLTELLRPSVTGRIVNVSSDSHHAGRMDLADPHFRQTRWSIGAAYGRSKLALMLWTLDLAGQLERSGVEVQMAHPGWVLTNLQNATGNLRLDRLVTAACRPIAMPVSRGAESVLFAATQPLPPLSYIGPDGAMALRSRPNFLLPSDQARDPNLARRVAEWARRETSAPCAGAPVSEHASAPPAPDTRPG